MVFFQGKHLWVNRLADDVAALVLDTDDSKTNRLTPPVLEELAAALDRVAGERRFRLLVLRSGKAASFSTGIDLHWLAGHASAADLEALARQGQALCDRIAGLPIPTAALIAGPCLGAGLELALACDYRAVVPRPGTVLGLTQIDLGLIPCWGGTQRLPRLVGLENSIKLLTSARRLLPVEALAIGLADAVAADGDDAPPGFLADPVKRDWTRRPRRTWRQRWLEAFALGRRFIFRGARHILSERLPQDMPAPAEAVAALRIAVAHADLAPGLDYEREAVARLADAPAFHNLLRLALERGRRRARPSRPDTARHVRAIGVVGATPVGMALVRQAARRGGMVVVHDEDRMALGYAFFELHHGLQEEVRRGLLPAASAAQALAAVRGTAEWQHFDELDLVLDTIEDGRRPERMRHLDRITTPATVLASTGATDTAARLRDGLRHPRRVAVLHFAGPPAEAALVEVARPEDAAEPVQQRLEDWSAALGKFSVTVADRPGLLVDRVWLPAMNEAALLLREGMPPRRIDDAMVRFGAAHGPLELMDHLGLDAVARLVEALRPTFAGRLTPEVGFAEMARQGMLGMRSGAGFYRYAGRRRRVNARAVALWMAGPEETWLRRAALSHTDQMDLAQRRLTSLMVLEAFHCLREGVVADADTLDFALAIAGWAPHRGGPVSYARQLGADVLRPRLEELAREYGARFAAPAGFWQWLDFGVPQ